jgi:hypothetical protein
MIFVREQFSANEVKYLLKPFKYLLKPFDEARLRGSGVLPRNTQTVHVLDLT